MSDSEMIRADVAEAIRNPTFTILRNRNAHRAGSYTSGFRRGQPVAPTTEVTVTRRSDPVLLSRWP